MKKFLTRILGMAGVLVGMCHNFCYADVIDVFPIKDDPTPSNTVNIITNVNNNVIPIVIIGVTIVVVVAIVTIILVKSKNAKEQPNVF